MQDAFISYSRRDRSFIDRVVAYLADTGFSYWLDTEDLHPADVWRDDLKTAIIESDNLIFTISPASVDSVHCRMELEFAVANNKRIIPIDYCTLRSDQTLPDVLKDRQWLTMALDDGGQWLEAIGAAIRNDHHWRNLGTDFLRRAENWQSGQGGVLARVELDSARNWLEKGALMQPGPSEQQIRYIHQSEAHHLAEAERWQALYAKALARQLAAQAHVLIDQRGVLLETAALLAVESMRRYPTLQGDRALRKALWLLPREVARMDGAHGTAFVRAAFSPDGRYVATFGEDGMVRVRECRSGESLACLQMDQCRELCFCPHQTHLAILSGDVTIWDWKADAEIARLGGAAVRAAAYSPDGGFLVTAATDRTTRLWDVDGYVELVQYQNAQTMHRVAVAPDAREVTTTNRDIAEIFRSPGAADQTIELGIGPGLRCQYSPDGKRLSQVSVGDYTATLFDAVTKEQLIFEERHWHSAFSGDGQYYAVASPEWDAHAYDLKTCNQAGIRMEVKPGTATVRREYLHARVSCKRGGSVRHDNSINRVALSHSGFFMATTSRDGTARVWESYRGREILRLLEKTGGGIQRLAFDPTEKWVTGWGPEVCRTWEAEGHRQVAPFKHRDGVLGLGFSGDGRLAATISQDRTACVWTIPDGREVVRVAVPGGGREYHVALNSCGTKLMIGHGHVFDVPSGNPVETRPGDGDVAAVSPDWKFAAVAGADGVMVIREGQNHSVVARTSVHQAPSHQISFSDRGDCLAWISDKGAAWVWHWRSNAEPQPVAPAIKVRGCRLDAAGAVMCLLDATDRRVAHIWDLAAAAHRVTLRQEADVTGTAFHPRADHLVTASVDFHVRVWHLAEGRQTAEFRHDADVGAVIFSPDGRYVLSAGGRSDRTARLWFWQPSDLIAEACARLDRDLTNEVWAQYLSAEDYRRTRDLQP